MKERGRTTHVKVEQKKKGTQRMKRESSKELTGI